MDGSAGDTMDNWRAEPQVVQRTDWSAPPRCARQDGQPTRRPGDPLAPNKAPSPDHCVFTYLSLHHLHHHAVRSG